MVLVCFDRQLHFPAEREGAFTLSHVLDTPYGFTGTPPPDNISLDFIAHRVQHAHSSSKIFEFSWVSSFQRRNRQKKNSMFPLSSQCEPDIPVK